MDSAEPTWFRAFILVAYYTGARRSDLLRLDWVRDVDLDGSRRRRSGPERAALLGHRTTDVDEAHYEAIIPVRERALIDGLRTFGRSA